MKKITLLVVLLPAFSILVSCFGGLNVPQKKKQTQETSNQVLASEQVLAPDEVNIVVSSDGSSKDEAIKTALRSAIEQAFGAFVSSNTTIINDQLVNDEIVSLSSGNVKSYDILTENVLPNNRYYVTLRATICMNKLVNYINSSSNSSAVEVDMDAFDKNIRLAEMNRIAEKSVIKNLISQIKSMDNLFDFSLQLEEPKVKDGLYVISGKVLVLFNQNTEVAIQLLKETLDQLGMSETEVEQYESMGVPYYTISDYDYYRIKLRNSFTSYNDRNELLRRIYGDFLVLSDRLFSERFNDYQIGDNVSMPSQLTIVSEEQFEDAYIREGKLKGYPIASELTRISYSNLNDVVFEKNYQNMICDWMGYKTAKKKTAGDIVAYREISISIPREQAPKYKNFVIRYKRKY